MHLPFTSPSPPIHLPFTSHSAAVLYEVLRDDDNNIFKVRGLNGG